MTRDAIRSGNGAIRAGVWLLPAFLLAVVLLEVHQPEMGLKLGNLVLVGSAALIVRAAALQRAAGLLPQVRLAAHDIVFGFYLLWCLGGVLWSVAPAQTVVHSLYLLIVWFATVSLSFAETTRTVRLFFLYSVVVSLLSIAIWPFFPDLALQPVSSTGAPELRGIIDHQLRLGMLLCLAIGLVLLAVANDDLQVVRGRWLKALLWGGILLCIAVLVLSRARGSTAAFAVALMVCGTLARQRWIMLASIAALAATILAIVLFGDQIAAATLQSASDKTLSGRTILWPKAIDLADQRPWFGYGFASFYTPIFEPYWKYYTPPSAHNTFIQAYFETGAIGAAFMFVLIITFIVSGLQISLILGRISYTLFAALFVTFTGLVDTVLAGKLTILVTVLLLIAAQEASELRRAIRGSLT